MLNFVLKNEFDKSFYNNDLSYIALKGVYVIQEGKKCIFFSLLYYLAKYPNTACCDNESENNLDNRYLPPPPTFYTRVPIEFFFSFPSFYFVHKSQILPIFC